MTNPEGATFVYAMDFANTRTATRPTAQQVDYTDAGNGMKINKEFFNDDSTYALMCNVQYVINGEKR